MAAILTDVGLVTTSLFATATSAMTFVTAQPIILIPVVIGIAMIGIRLVKKFVRV